MSSGPPINDHWTLHLGSLGMTKAAQGLAEQIVTCAPPYVISVQGKWGSGKTSMMRYAMAALGGSPLGVSARPGTSSNQELPHWLSSSWQALQGDSERFIWDSLGKVVPPEVGKDIKAISDHIRRGSASPLSPPQKKMRASRCPRVFPIWFNPWQHQGSESPIFALLQEIRSQFPMWYQATQSAQKIAEVTIEAGLGILGDLIAALTPGLPKFGESVNKMMTGVRAIGERWEKEHFYALSDAQRFNIVFETAIRRLLDIPDGDQGAFHDRQTHRIASRRLVVFIDDLDRCSEAQMVALIEGIKLYLQTSHCVFVFGTDHLALRRAVHKTVSGADMEIAREYVEKLFQSVVHVPTPAKPQLFIEDLCTRCGMPPSAIPTLVDLTERNPRKMKNFINAASSAWKLLDGKGHEIDDFLLWFYLQTNHPEVARLIMYDPQHIEALHKVLCSNQIRANGDAKPVEVFLTQQFRHAFDDALGGGDEKSQAFVDLVASEVRTRLDRLQTDRAFVRKWQERFKEAGESKGSPTPSNITAFILSEDS